MAVVEESKLHEENREEETNKEENGDKDQPNETKTDNDGEKLKEKEDQLSEEETSEDEAVAENSDTSDERAKEMKEALAKLEQELENLQARYLRVQADFDNYRKRTKQEKQADAKYRSQTLAELLLPVLDNFERALVVQTTNEESEAILKGVEMVYRQFIEALKQEGIEEVEALGEPFDPHKHQAVAQEKSEEHESGIVIEVLQKGYRLKDRIIRPAMVKVSE